MVLAMGGAFFAGAGSYPAVIRQSSGSCRECIFCSGPGSHPAVIRQSSHILSTAILSRAMVLSRDLRVSGNHLGDLTVAQSICRDLDMGECESRPDLVKRVVKAVQKRKWHTVSEAVLCVAEAVANMNLRR